MIWGKLWLWMVVGTTKYYERMFHSWITSPQPRLQWHFLSTGWYKQCNKAAVARDISKSCCFKILGTLHGHPDHLTLHLQMFFFLMRRLKVYGLCEWTKHVTGAQRHHPRWNKSHFFWNTSAHNRKLLFFPLLWMYTFQRKLSGISHFQEMEKCECHQYFLTLFF